MVKDTATFMSWNVYLKKKERKKIVFLLPLLLHHYYNIKSSKLKTYKHCYKQNIQVIISPPPLNKFL